METDNCSIKKIYMYRHRRRNFYYRKELEKEYLVKILKKSLYIVKIIVMVIWGILHDCLSLKAVVRIFRVAAFLVYENVFV